jgi:small basic protein
MSSNCAVPNEKHVLESLINAPNQKGFGCIVMEEKTLKSIAPVSLAVMMGIISAIIALIIGLIYAGAFSAIMSTISSYQTTVPFPINTTFGGVLAVLIPIFTTVGGFIAGFIQGLLIAVLYNFLAPRIGGIKVRVE